MMRNIVFDENCSRKFDEAYQLISKVEARNREAALKMRQSLDSCIARLITMLMNTGNDIQNAELHIGPDFVEGSFSFVFKYGDTFGMNGGVILHGFGETFAVELTSPDYPHWSIHT